jgi:hypothetical protein
VRSDKEGSLFHGKEFKKTFYLKSIRPIAPKEEWNLKSTHGQISHIVGGVPYGDDKLLEEVGRDELKAYVKQALYTITLHKYEKVKTPEVNITLEFQW